MATPSHRLLDGRSTITALLGPTNTGKTHRAITRMLGHRTGMIGLPLRLLAREVYDRVSVEVGEDAVALVTGEERRVPPRPRYWVCTVEAMPIDRGVEFLAVDEVQLAAHHERGHVFTDRLLRARGYLETWFLGADTMVPLVERLVPTADVRRHPRYSRLTWAGASRLSALPSRTAVVAFSASQVYELAERIRRRRGGTAVVLGALSPRTRNAQVALYQSGEVDFMVATDAIGMGLNMDVDHVALAALHKFDGRGVRALSPAELAQIAGRAGRWTRDGTFGSLSELGSLDPEVIEAIENHAFAPVRQLVWRNPDLDFSSLEGLSGSLAIRPRQGSLRLQEQADDTDALSRLALLPEVRRVDGDADAIALLWEVCQVPDYRQTLTESHVQLLAEIFAQLTGPAGVISPDWMAPRIERLDRVDGDIETLMTRLAWVRTWTYVAHRARWVAQAEHWQGLTRAIEDRLSDALHDRLTSRFVDHRTLVLVEQMAAGQPLVAHVDAHGRVTAAGQALGRLEGFEFLLASNTPADAARTVKKAARVALAGEIEALVERLVQAPHEALRLDEHGRLLWDEAPLGRLLPGPDLKSPELRLYNFDLLGAGARSRVHRRLLAWVRDFVTRLLAPLGADAGHGPARGLVYQLDQALGTLPAAAVRAQVAALGPADRRRLGRLGVRIGPSWVYCDRLLAPEAVEQRAQLAAVHLGLERPPPLPAGASVAAAEGVPAAFYVAIGYPLAGPRAVRVDLLEQASARMRGLTRAGSGHAPRDLHVQLGCSREELPGVLAALGWQRREDGRYLFPSQDSRAARS